MNIAYCYFALAAQPGHHPRFAAPLTNRLVQPTKCITIMPCQGDGNQRGNGGNGDRDRSARVERANVAVGSP